MESILSFYRTQSPLSDPGEYAFLYDDLPDDLEQLFKIINGVLIHAYDARDTYNPTSVQRREKFLRTIRQRLERIIELDPSPLTHPREIKQQQISYCRDFALFLTSILRHKGYAARARAGFGAYFDYSPQPPFRGDHWITEFWNPSASSWQLVDAETGGEDIDRLLNIVKRPLKKGIDFEHLRTNQDFYLAPYSWLAVRRGEIDVKLYYHNAHWKGWPMLRGNLLHDFQSLNNLEMGLFDYWDDLHAKAESEMTNNDRILLDRIAEVCLNPDETFVEMRALFNELPRTRILRSRLQLIGVLGDSSQSQTALDLLDSDMSRLIELTESHEEAGLASEQFSLPKESSSVGKALAISPDDFDGITIIGARENNLKNINVRIPRHKFIVMTGVSGSGKSSLAFDTIYAEAQRRYIESLSSYAQQFTRQMEKPDVDKVIGLNPAIAIEQHSVSPTSRSTVGSITEISDYLRLLFARIGRMHCPRCGRAIEAWSAFQITRRLVNLPPGTHFKLLAPMNRYQQYNINELIDQAREQGFNYVRINKQICDLMELGISNQSPYSGDWQDSVEVLISEVTLPQTAFESGSMKSQLISECLTQVDQALEVGKGIIIIALEGEDLYLSNDTICPTCDLTLPRLEPRILNPNTIHGMCMECNGTGLKLQVDPDRIITNPHKSILDDASSFYMLRNIRKSTSQYWMNYMKSIAKFYGADLETPWNELPEAFRHTILFGTEGEKIKMEFSGHDENGSYQISQNQQLDGVIHQINRLYRQTKSENQRRYYRQYMNEQPCPLCSGERLNTEARFVTLANQRFPEMTDKSMEELLSWVKGLRHKLDERQLEIANDILIEIEKRLGFICEVGLPYLTLDRPLPTLSGGEAQRIRLAGQIGTELTGMLYVLDEPSIGLHPRDQKALLDLLCHLRDLGNTILVVEHDADTMRRADWLIDIGPGAGIEGGKLVAVGTPAEVMADSTSLTGRYLSGKASVISNNRNKQRESVGWLTLKGANLHNLKSVDVSFPLGLLICVTGVSGSGKSSLITQTLYPVLAQHLQNKHIVAGPHNGIEGVDRLKRVVHITQKPIGRNPRSNPGTYVGALDEIRKVFASTKLAKERSYPDGYFSFNTKGGRCEACQGYGMNKLRMHFMADVWVRCPECEGQRFMPQVLEVRYQDANISEVLEFDVAQACEFFAEEPKICLILNTLKDVGLGYLKLGQSATTLSGGEAQRIKLAKELSKQGHGDTLYILDEPTTGLHFADIQKLLDILNCLVDNGNTVIVIEHNMDMISAADWIIDLGPEGGEQGGSIIAEGPPEEIARVEKSYTGKFLKQALRKKYK